MKKVISLLSAVLFAAFLTSCAETAQDKTTTPSVKADTGDMVLTQINNQVKDFSVDGFGGASSKIKSSEDLENMKRIVGLVKPVIDKLPDGYVMMIKGHAAAYPTKALQRSVSKARAYAVYKELKKAGVPASKMSYKGVDIKEPLEGYDAKDFKQRRVSFTAIKK